MSERWKIWRAVANTTEVDREEEIRTGRKVKRTYGNFVNILDYALTYEFN